MKKLITLFAFALSAVAMNAQDTLYFTPKGWWLNDGAVFDVGLINTTDKDTVYYFLDSVPGHSGTYYAQLPSTDYNVIRFFRCSNEQAQPINEWGTGWNRTSDMAFDYSEGNHWTMSTECDNCLKTNFIINNFGEEIEEPVYPAVTIRFKQTGDNLWEKVYVYSYGPELWGAWPGLAPEKDADGWYTIEVEEGTLSVGTVIFNDGTGGDGHQLQADNVNHETACYEITLTEATEVDCPASAIEGLSKIDKVKIYPNPATSTLTIDLDNIKTVNVINTGGKKVMSVNKSKVVNVSKLPAGVYFLEIMQDNSVIQYSKFVKK